MFTKRNLFMLLSVSAPDVAKKRKNWAKTISKIEADKLVFPDESGVNTNMTRIYGCYFGSTRSVDKAPLNTPVNTTIFSYVKING